MNFQYNPISSRSIKICQLSQISGSIHDNPISPESSVCQFRNEPKFAQNRLRRYKLNKSEMPVYPDPSRIQIQM